MSVAESHHTEGPNGRASSPETNGETAAQAERMRFALAGALQRSPEDTKGSPAELVHEFVKNVCWKRLTRNPNSPEGLAEAVADEKVNGMPPVIYVPFGDTEALRICRNLIGETSDITVRMLPEHIDEETAAELGKSPGLLMMAHDGKGNLLPYPVPGGRFNEMYGWDAYFMAMGLAADDKWDLVRATIEHQKYQIKHYGKILNANRPYYISRGQPPVFTGLLKLIAQKMPPDQITEEDRAWLRECILAARAEYENNWSDEHHVTSGSGLSRFYVSGKGIPVETEQGHFDAIFREYAGACGLLNESTTLENCKQTYIRYLRKELDDISLNGRDAQWKEFFAKLDEFFTHDRAGRASGHDTSNHLIGKAAHLNPIGLNSMLYKFESDIADLIRDYFGGQLSETDTEDAWRNRAIGRAERMRAFLWDAERGMFLDYNFKDGVRVPYRNPTAFYAMWSGLATKEEAESIVKNLLPHLEEDGGLAASDEESRGEVSQQRPLRQWDYPFGWAPHQILTWEALEKYGYHEEAQRLIYKWLYMITMDALRHGGAIAEKYDVIACNQDLHAEYGNVGGDVGIEQGGAGFGWTNASFQQGFSMLDEKYLVELKKNPPTHPDDLFGIHCRTPRKENPPAIAA